MIGEAPHSPVELVVSQVAQVVLCGSRRPPSPSAVKDEGLIQGGPAVSILFSPPCWGELFVPPPMSSPMSMLLLHPMSTHAQD